MTTDVASVRDDAGYKEIVRLMQARNVSAVPVVDTANRIVGIVSEADLLPKEHAHEHEAFMHRGRRRRRRKAAGLLASDVMTSPVITVAPDAPLSEAARTMDERGVKRLPVVDDSGAMVGIVSRKDLLAIFLRSDDDIWDEVVHDVFERFLWIWPQKAGIAVSVSDGVVTVEGRLERKSLIPITLALIGSVDGVVGVVDHLWFEIDDTHMKPEGEPVWGVLPRALRWP
ncbi:MAG: CBS domain-containing protein [Actinomycetota bacterium]